jgi:quercetin dioxygenase-like cupin family protein
MTPSHNGRRGEVGRSPGGRGPRRLATDEQRTTLLILVRGRFRLDISVASTTLEKEGDYAVWGPGIDHSWQAEEDSIVITVRWPSIPSS